MQVCPIGVTARKLDADTFVPNARLAGATPMWEWLGDEGSTAFKIFTSSAGLSDDNRR